MHVFQTYNIIPSQDGWSIDLNGVSVGHFKSQGIAVAKARKEAKAARSRGRSSCVLVLGRNNKWRAEARYREKRRVNAGLTARH
jgi:hypothetical protein